MILAILAAIPFVATDPAGVRSLAVSSRVTLEVITADTLYDGPDLHFMYSVDGLRLVSAQGADTLAWAADLPAAALAAARASGASSITETRRLRILSCTESYAGAVIRVTTSRDGRPSTTYAAYRTWLIQGVPLDLDAVVQHDSLFVARLSAALDVPAGRSLDGWLWRNGHWLDTQSFLILPGEDGVILRIGLPSWQGLDSIMVVDLDPGSLHTASSAMLD